MKSDLLRIYGTERTGDQVDGARRSANAKTWKGDGTYEGGEVEIKENKELGAGDLGKEGRGMNLCWST